VNKIYLESIDVKGCLLSKSFSIALRTILKLASRPSGVRPAPLPTVTAPTPMSVSQPQPETPQTPVVRPARRIASAQLMAGKREIIIEHGQDEYRLRITGSGKLILTK